MDASIYYWNAVHAIRLKGHQFPRGALERRVAAALIRYHRARWNAVCSG